MNDHYFQAQRIGSSQWHGVYLDRHGRYSLVRNAARLPIVYRSYDAALLQARFAYYTDGGTPQRRPHQLELPLDGGRLANAS